MATLPISKRSNAKRGTDQPNDKKEYYFMYSTLSSHPSIARNMDSHNGPE